MAKVDKSKEVKEEEEEPPRNARRWLKIGWELEGGWDCSEMEVRRRAPCSLQHDGSVRDTGAAGFIGEAVCDKPYEKLGPALSAMKKVWPDHVNTTCGFHIHVSFNTGDYASLADPTFYDYFKEQWRLWGVAHLGPEGARDCKEPEFWNRLSGRNQYCEARFQPEEQMRQTGKVSVRYTHLNYCWTLQNRRTIECRLLPMFKDREIAALAVKHLLWIYSSWLERGASDDTSLASASIVDDTTKETTRLALAEEFGLGMPLHEVEECECSCPEVTPDMPLVIQYKDPKKTAKAMAKKLAKLYPDLAQAVKEAK